MKKSKILFVLLGILLISGCINERVIEVESLSTCIQGCHDLIVNENKEIIGCNVFYGGTFYFIVNATECKEIFNLVEQTDEEQMACVPGCKRFIDDNNRNIVGCILEDGSFRLFAKNQTFCSDV